MYSNHPKMTFSKIFYAVQELKRLLELPLWQVPALPPNQTTYTLPTISAYIDSVVGRVAASTIPPPGDSGASGGARVDRGYLLLSHHWQARMGDLSLTEELVGAERLAAEAGLTLVLTLNPFVSTDSVSFKEGVQRGLFVMERNSSSQARPIPALTWFKVFFGSHPIATLSWATVL
jgi:hypothetical protein